MAVNIGKFLENRKVAVLLSEVQRGVIGDLSQGAMTDAAKTIGLIPNAALLAKAGRERGAQVVHCLADTRPGRFGQNMNARLFMGNRPKPGSPPHNPDGDQPASGVFEDGDLLSIRPNGLGPMSGTPLDSQLRIEGVSTVILAGVSLNVAIIALTMDCVNYGYQVIIARDAVVGFPVEYGQQVLDNTLSLLATVATTEEIIAAWPKAADA